MKLVAKGAQGIYTPLSIVLGWGSFFGDAEVFSKFNRERTARTFHSNRDFRSWISEKILREGIIYGSSAGKRFLRTVYFYGFIFMMHGASSVLVLLAAFAFEQQSRLGSSPERASTQLHCTTSCAAALDRMVVSKASEGRKAKGATTTPQDGRSAGSAPPGRRLPPEREGSMAR